MQYKTLIFRKNFLLAALLALVWLTSCVQEEFESIPPQTGNGVRFTLTVPDVEMPSVSSRTMAGTGVAKKEDEIKTVDILVLMHRKLLLYIWNGLVAWELHRIWLIITLR